MRNVPHKLWVAVLEKVGRDGMSYGQAAKMFGLTRNMVAGWDFRARRGHQSAFRNFKRPQRVILRAA